MDLKERSPSFLGVKIPKSAEKTSSKAQNIKFKPMPSMQLLQLLKMNSPLETQASSTSTKKLSMKAVRTNELNLNEFKEFNKKTPKITTRNIRKQLWSVEKGDGKWTNEKGDKLRRVTVMKPHRESLRKSVYSRPSMIQAKKNIVRNQTKSLSIDDTLPLMDMEQFTVTKIKRSLFPQQGKPLNQRKTTSNININKLSTVSTNARKSVKTPTIVITPADKAYYARKMCKSSTPSSSITEKSAKKSLIKTIHNNKPKIESEKKPDTMGIMIEKLSNIEDKISTFEDIKALLGTICVHLGIEVPENFLAKPEKNKQQSSINNNCSNIKKDEKLAVSPPSFKKDVTSTPLPTINENHVNSTEFKETVYKLSPFIKQTSDVPNKKSELKLSPCTSKVTNQLENNDTGSNSLILKVSPCIPKEISSRLENIEIITESKQIENCEKHKNDDDNNNNSDNKKVLDSVEPRINLKNISPSTPTSSIEKTKNPLNLLKPEDIVTPKAEHHKTNDKYESTVKLKKTWITQFEQLENKLLNNSNDSVNLHSSPDDSPVVPLQIDKIVNDAEKGISVKKSPSTSNLADGNDALRKKIFFKAKETDLLTESICVYNELRDELPKFLSTPMNKTNKAMSFMTPSVQGNEKKLISRRVQEQLLRLNDC